MRTLRTGLAVLAVTIAAAVPSSAVEPETATVRGELVLNCYGCGTTTASFRGAVVAGTGRWVAGAAVSGSFTVDQPAATCPAADAASGSLTSNGRVLTTLRWSRTGTALSGVTGAGAAVAGTSAVTSPAGQPCGTRGPVVASVTFTIGGPVPVWEAHDQVRAVRGGVRETAAPVVDELLHTATTTQQLRSWVDGIHIVAQTNFGGPQPVYEGAFADPALWDCTATMTGTPTVTCTADPTSGIDWECGLMHASAHALSETIGITTYWGRGAAYVSCDTDVLVTAQANQGNPLTQAQTPMGAVTTVVCKAQLDSNDGSPALPPYHVICVDPPYAG